jgi:hypothetical protein
MTTVSGTDLSSRERLAALVLPAALRKVIGRGPRRLMAVTAQAGGLGPACSPALISALAGFLPAIRGRPRIRAAQPQIEAITCLSCGLP